MLRLTNKNKLLVSVMALLLLGFAVSAGVAYIHVKEQMLVEVEHTQRLNAQSAASRLAHWSEENIRAVSTLADFLSQTDEPFHRNPVLAQMFEQVRMSQRQLYLGYALQQDGYYYVNDWPIPEGYDPRIRPWYLASKNAGKPLLSWPFVGVGDKVSYVAFTAPVERDGEFFGVVSGDYPLDFVESTVLNIELELNGIALLTDRKGQVLIEPEQPLSKVHRSEIKSVVAEVVRGDDSPDAKRFEFDDGEYIFIVSSIPHADWLLLLAIPKTELKLTLYRETVSLLSHFLLVFIVVMVLFYLSNQQVFSPIIDFLEVDENTGLPNKSKFKTQLKERLRYSHRTGLLVIVSMDNFNRLSAAYSNEQMNCLLRQMKQRVQAQLKQTALLGQFSECRLIAYIPGKSISQSDDWEKWLDKLLSRLQQHFYVDDNTIDCSFSIGGCAFPQHGQKVEELINNSFAALAIEKQRTVSSYGLYAEKLKRQLGHEVLFVNALKKAIDIGELSVVYQPQFDSRTHKMVGMEALLRWYSSELESTISPVEFIEVAESCGLIVPLGDFVIESVAKQMLKWRQAGMAQTVVSINVSPKQLLCEGFTEQLLATLQRYQVSNEQIELEITETSALQEPEQTIAVLQRLRSLGFKVAIDDFGTGYSSLQYLKVMPVDKLKIDRAFIRDLPDSPKDLAIVDMIVGMAQTLNCQVLAEGAETQEQIEILQKHGCNLIQGYFYAKPLHPDVAIRMPAKIQQRLEQSMSFEEVLVSR